LTFLEYSSRVLRSSGPFFKDRSPVGHELGSIASESGSHSLQASVIAQIPAVVQAAQREFFKSLAQVFITPLSPDHSPFA